MNRPPPRSTLLPSTTLFRSLVASLGRGKLIVRQGENHVREFVIDGGFMEVLDNVVMVLVDSLTDPSAA